jgi:hypothetical protein
VAALRRGHTRTGSWPTGTSARAERSEPIERQVANPISAPATANVARGQSRELKAAIPVDAPAGSYRLIVSASSDSVDERLHLDARFDVHSDSSPSGHPPLVHHSDPLARWPCSVDRARTPGGTQEPPGGIAGDAEIHRFARAVSRCARQPATGSPPSIRFGAPSDRPMPRTQPLGPSPPVAGLGAVCDDVPPLVCVAPDLSSRCCV